MGWLSRRRESEPPQPLGEWAAQAAAAAGGAPGMACWLEGIAGVKVFAGADSSAQGSGVAFPMTKAALAWQPSWRELAAMAAAIAGQGLGEIRRRLQQADQAGRDELKRRLQRVLPGPLAQAVDLLPSPCTAAGLLTAPLTPGGPGPRR